MQVTFMCSFIVSTPIIAERVSARLSIEDLFSQSTYARTCVRTYVRGGSRSGMSRGMSLGESLHTKEVSRPAICRGVCVTQSDTFRYAWLRYWSAFFDDAAGPSRLGHRTQLL